MSENKLSKAYPNFNQYLSFSAPRNTQKWISAVKDMYYRMHKGLDKKAALEQILSGWDEMEKLDFKNWLRFYEENDHKKYSQLDENITSIKVAQVGYWEDVNRAGYFVPIHKDPDVGNAIDLAKNPETNSNAQAEERRNIIESQRNKIVSRLDSAEKLLRSHEGQIFAGNEFESLMHIIYELKKKIHTVNKVSLSTKLYEDMIIREANILNKKGFSKASDFLYKIAQNPPPAQPPSPMTGGGLPGTLPGSAPGQVPVDNNTPSLKKDLPVEEKVDDGMKGFLSGLNGKQDQQADDDIIVIDDLEAEDWVVEAQAMPTPAPAPKPAPAPQDKAPSKKPAAPDENLEVTEKVDTGKNFDNLMGQAFQNLSIADVIAKLEDLAKIFKTRELPRQLSFVDLMLDHLGLASFFPSLAEATNKSLESNQYISTRIEDILSRLRGTLETRDIDLKNDGPTSTDPSLPATKQKLQQDEDDEKAKKKMRKDLADQSLQQANEPKPELEVEEDLNQPAEMTNQMPEAPAQPAPTPAR